MQSPELPSYSLWYGNMSKNEVLKKNLQFIYGRSSSDVPDLYSSDKNKALKQVYDPDKVQIIPTINAPITDLLADIDVISDFDKEYEALHPCFPLDVLLMGDSKPYPSFEHALQASKFIKTEIKDTIRTMKDIKEVKRYVSKLKDQTEILLNDWQSYCLTLGECLLRDKCIRHPIIKQLLLQTKHSKLVFKNDYNDTFWGYNAVKKIGQNHLGKLLEKIRTELQQGTIYRYWIHDHLRLYDESEHLRIILYSPKIKNEEYSNYLTQGSAASASANAETIEEEMKFIQESRFADDTVPKGEKYSEEDEEYILDEKTIALIGQKNDQYRINDVLLFHYSISRQHAAIALDKDGQLYIIDLDSRNKTFLNGQVLIPFQFTKITPSTASSQNKDFIQFGALGKLYQIKLYLNSQEIKKEEIFEKILEDTQGNSSSGAYGGGSFLTKEEEQENTVFVRNLSYECSEEDLRKFFETCGGIEHLSVPIDKKTNQNKGIAFITFKDYTGTLQALIRDGDELKGRYIQVKRSDARKSDLNAEKKVEVKKERKRESAFDRKDEESRWGGKERNSNSSSQPNRDRRETVKTEHDRRDNRRREDSRERNRRGRESPPRRERSRSPLRSRRSNSRRRDNSRERNERRRGWDRDYEDRDRPRPRSSSRRSKERKRSSPSPPRRRSASPSASPPRRRKTSPSSSPSPPRKPIQRESESPPRRRQASPARQRSPSPSPPRRKREISSSPPRKPANNKKHEDASPSPPRRRRDVDSPSPPRKRQKGSPSNTPPRRQSQRSPDSPPRRK